MARTLIEWTLNFVGLFVDYERNYDLADMSLGTQAVTQLVDPTNVQSPLPAEPANCRKSLFNDKRKLFLSRNWDLSRTLASLVVSGRRHGHGEPYFWYSFPLCSHT
jgi:hypothetical protein